MSNSTAAEIVDLALRMKPDSSSIGAAYQKQRKHCAICSLNLDGCSIVGCQYALYGLPTVDRRQPSRLRGIMLLWRRIGFASR